MGHHINGFIASRAELAAAARKLPYACICPLSLGFALLPLTEDIASPEGLADEHELLRQVTQPMADWAVQRSKEFPIMYVETEYFGGQGDQSAILWLHGFVRFGPVRTDDSVPLLNGAINVVARHNLW